MPEPEKNSLDQTDTITSLDPSGMVQLIGRFPEMLAEIYEKLKEQKEFPSSPAPSSLLIAGMGGSGIVGDVLSQYVSSATSIYPIVVKDYHLPQNLPDRSLVLCVSYSGNTEETISIYQAARERNFPRVIIATGGKLSELAKTDRVPWLPIPTGLPPRAALPYLLGAALFFLEHNKIAHPQEDILESQKILQKKRGEFQPESPLRENLAKQIATKIYQRLPILGGSTGVGEVAAVRWKGQLNENSKLPALTMILPEGNHNEIVPLASMAKGEFPFHLVQLRDHREGARMIKRLDITKSLIAPHLDGTTEVCSEGKSLLARLLSLIYLGDYVSLYTAYLRRVDPTPVPPIDRLKRELSR